MSDNKLTLQDLTGKDEDGLYNINLDSSNIDETTQDKISILAVNELLDLKKLKTISRVKPDQITNITKLYLFADTFKTPFARQLADTILQLQISLNGLGRQELVQLVQQRIGGYILPEPPVKKGIFK